MNENNRLIAEFMGWTYSKSGKTARIGKGIKSSPYRLSDIKYDTSWDWLMPVVEKIEAMHGMYVDIYRDATKIRYCPKEISEWVTIPYDQETKINHVYKAVIEFIKFHNMDNLTYTSLKQKPRKPISHVLASDGKVFATPGLATDYMKLWNLKGKLRFVR